MKNLPLNYPGLHQNGYLCYTCRRWLVIAGGERTGESCRARPSEAASAAHAPPAGPGCRPGPATVRCARLIRPPSRDACGIHFSSMLMLAICSLLAVAPEGSPQQPGL